VTARLSCSGLTGGRGSLVAFRDVTFTVEAGKVLALLGPNGAGKTSLLLTLAGILPGHSGHVDVDGHRLRNGRPRSANRARLVFVPDDRCLFPGLSVEENLRVASHVSGRSPREMLGHFPALEARWRLRAGSLSGGEQQMLAMARALIQDPKVLLVDELSMGLAPLVAESLFGAVRGIADEHGCAVLLVEQHVPLALAVADDVIVLRRGDVVLRGAASALARRGDDLKRAYFGDEEVGAR